jgi:hypothetical protein
MVDSDDQIIDQGELERLTALKSAQENLADARLSRGLALSDSMANPDIGGSTPDVYGSGMANAPLDETVVESGTLMSDDLIESDLPILDKPTLLAPLLLKKGSADYYYQITPGYVNLEMPTLSGTALDAATPPELFISQDSWVWIKVVGTFGSPDTYVVTIEGTVSNSPPASDSITGTTFTSYFPIGWIDYSEDEIHHIHTGGNLTVRSFGNSNIWSPV